LTLRFQHSKYANFQSNLRINQIRKPKIDPENIHVKFAMNHKLFVLSGFYGWRISRKLHEMKAFVRRNYGIDCGKFLMEISIEIFQTKIIKLNKKPQRWQHCNSEKPKTEKNRNKNNCKPLKNTIFHQSKIAQNQFEIPFEKLLFCSENHENIFWKKYANFENSIQWFGNILQSGFL
jgi:hypothetical protein